MVTPRLRSCLGLLLFAPLGGCALVAPPTETTEKSPPVSAFYEDAACQADPSKGLAMAKTLLAREPDDPATQLVHAYLIERNGRPVQAWELYDSLAGGDFRQETSLACQGTLVYRGSVSDVARFRGTWLAQTLRAEGIEVVPVANEPKVTKTAEPEMQSSMVVLPPPFAKAPNPAPSQGALMPKKRDTPSPKPTAQMDIKKTDIFVHLASYNGPKALDRGWQDISRRHKSILGAYEKATQSVTLKDQKKTVLRLGFYTEDRKQAANICKALKEKRQYCAILK